MNRREYIERQIELLELSKDILKKHFTKMKQDEEFLEKYWELFFNKRLPPHLSQPIDALKAKLSIKPAVEKVAEIHNISWFEARKLIKNLWYSEALKK